MRIPTLNPLRFYKPNGTKSKDNNSFSDASQYWNGLKGNYTPLFQDKVDSIVYEDELSGSYGFDSTDEFDLFSATDARIENCKMCVNGGRIEYNIGIASIGQRIFIKLSGDCNIIIKEGATNIYEFDNASNIVNVLLDQNFTDLKVAFTNTSNLCVTAIMLCEGVLDYTICEQSKEAPLTDICPLGGVYLVTSSTLPFIDETPSTYTKTLYEYVFDTSTISNYGVGKIQITFNNTYFLEYNNNVDFITDLQNAYDWVAFSVDGDLVTLSSPYAIDAIDFNNTSMGNFSSATKDSTKILYADNYYFIANGTADYEGVLTLDFETNTGDLVINIDDVDFTKTNLVSYAVVSAIESFNYVNCCRVFIGDYESEYFSVLTQEEKEDRKLINLSYSSVFMDKQMAFSDYFDASILINANLSKSDGADIEVFIGQSKNTNLKNFAKDIKMFQTGAIPDYLVSILELVFGCDTVYIDGCLYSAEDNPSISEIESITDLFEFEIKLRKQNYNYII